MSARCRATFQIKNKLGLHARAAAKLVKVANRFVSTVTLERDNQTADAKSIMGVLLLCAHKGADLTVAAVGHDAEQAVSAIGELIEARFGEDE